MSALDRHVKLQLEKHEEGSESIRGLILDSVRADPKEKTEPARTDENEPETTWFAQLKSRVQQQSAIDRRKKSKRRIMAVSRGRSRAAAAARGGSPSKAPSGARLVEEAEAVSTSGVPSSPPRPLSAQEPRRLGRNAHDAGRQKTRPQSAPRDQLRVTTVVDERARLKLQAHGSERLAAFVAVRFRPPLLHDPEPTEPSAEDIELAERNLEEAAAAFESVQLSVSNMVAEAYLLRLRGDVKLWAARKCLDAQQPLQAVDAFLDAAEAYAEYFDSLFYRHTNATKRLLGQESKVTPKAEAAEDEHRHACLRSYLRAILALAARCCQESECTALLDQCELVHVQSALSHLRADKSAAQKAAPEMRGPARVDASRAPGRREPASQLGVAVQEGKPMPSSPEPHRKSGARRRKRRGVRAKLHALLRDAVQQNAIEAVRTIQRCERRRQLRKRRPEAHLEAS